MAEPVGLTLSAMAITGVITEAVDCFKIIQLIAEDFISLSIRLTGMYMRLNRLGKAIMQQINLDKLSSGEIETVETHIDRINHLLQKAKAKSQIYATANKEKSSLDVILLDSNGLAKTNRSRWGATSDNFRKYLRDSQKRISRTKKAKWAIYNKNHFKSLFAQITNLIQGLEMIFPAVKELELGLAKMELKDVNTEDMDFLVTADGQDNAVLKKQVTQSFENELDPHFEV